MSMIPFPKNAWKSPSIFNPEPELFTSFSIEYPLSTEQKLEMQRNLQRMIENMVSLTLETTAPTGLLANLKIEMTDLQEARKQINKIA